jgi:hypothetical protein
MGVAISAIASGFVCIVLMSRGGSLIKTNPALFASLMGGLILGNFLVIAIFVRRYVGAAKRFAAEQTRVESAGDSKSRLWEYRSRFELLGLPFVHLRFGGSLGRRMEDRLKMAQPPVKAWIAITDTCAIGVLFAYGGTAIAPVSVGALAVGLFSVGAFSVGALAVGGIGLGIWALAPFAVGWQAFGDCAIAWNAAWGFQYAVAPHFALGAAAFATRANSELARRLMNENPFFQFCIAKMSLGRMIVIIWVWLIPMTISQIAQLWITSRKRHQK